MWYVFCTLISSKYPNDECGERRRRMEREEVMWVIMVDLEVEDV